MKWRCLRIRLFPTERVGDLPQVQLRRQYELELKLAERLRSAPKEKRTTLYKQIYDELFRTIIQHPQLIRKSDSCESAQKVTSELSIVRHFVGENSTFLEVGAGDCALSLRVAAFATQVYAIEVSDELTKNLRCPGNFTLIGSDASDIAVTAESVDFAYSNQVVEHLHPEDCAAHLASVGRALIPGGKYMCVTPNRLSGPWDVSRYFDNEARGLHLKEYTYADLAQMFGQAGFGRVHAYVRAKGLHLLLPVSPIALLERVLGSFPARTRRTVANWYPFRIVLGVILVGTK